MRLVGPNCMGVFSAPVALNGTYFWELPRLPGGIAVVSQSGAYGGLIVRHLGGLGLGVARFLSIGNQADVDVADALEFLAGDPRPRWSPASWSRSRTARRFVAAAEGHRRASRWWCSRGAGPTPDAARRALTPARSPGPRRCTPPHSARPASCSAGETEELFDAIQALVAPSPAAARASLAMVTVSGGPSVIAADIAEALGSRCRPRPTPFA